MKLEPLYMYKYYQKRDFENMQKYHILDCFECGSCAFNCPARMPLTHAFKTAKLMFQAKAYKEKLKAEAEAAKEAHFSILTKSSSDLDAPKDLIRV